MDINDIFNAIDEIANNNITYPKQMPLYKWQYDICLNPGYIKIADNGKPYMNGYEVIINNYIQ